MDVHDELIENLLSICRDDIDCVVKGLEEEARTNDELQHFALILGLKQMVRTYLTRQRREADTSQRVPNITSLTRAQRGPALRRLLSHPGVQAYWKYRLWGGQRVMTSNQPQILLSAAKRRKQSNGQLRCAEWEETVAALLPDATTTVEQALNAGIIKNLPDYPEPPITRPTE